MGKQKAYRKRIMVSLLAVMVMLSATGCDMDDYVDAFGSTVDERANANIEVLNKFYTNGIITQETKEVLAKGITKNAEDIKNMSSNVSDVKKHISHVRENLSDLINNEKPEKTDKIQKIIDDLKPSSLDLSNPSPFYFMSESEINSLNDSMNLKIYILKSDSNLDGKSIDKLSDAVQKIKSDPNNASKYSSVLDSYFKSSETTLLDNTSKPILKETKYVKPSEVQGSGIGTDICFKSNGYYTIAARVYEFNPEAVDEIIGSDEATSDKYLRVNNRLYLLEYPFNIITGIKTEGTDKFKIETGDSKCSVNILNGIVKNNNGNSMIPKPENEGSNLYNIDTEISSGADGFGNNSFMFYGITDYKNIGASNITITSCPALVLRDYLELNYMPNLIENENFSAFGRRIRVLKTEGGETDVFAKFIDKNGNVVMKEDGTESVSLYIDDIVDKTSGSGSNSNTYLKIGLGGNAVSGSAVQTSDSAVSTGETGFAVDASVSLQNKYTNNISISMVFPSADIASQDSPTSDGRVETFGIATSKSMFESSLYSNWINLSEDAETGSLLWWNKWLSENGYTYTIDANILLDYLNGNYSYDLAKEDFVILDLATINKIQQEYDEEDKVADITGFRTASAILAIIMMAYAILLPCMWLIDSNIALNLNKSLLSIITFGKWVPIENISDTPDIDCEGSHYMTLSATVRGALIIFGFGILLLMLDIIGIVNYLVSLFGGFGEKIQEIIFGL